jgi:hypothetical protein
VHDHQEIVDLAAYLDGRRDMDAFLDILTIVASQCARLTPLRLPTALLRG